MSSPGASLNVIGGSNNTSRTEWWLQSSDSPRLHHPHSHQADANHISGGTGINVSTDQQESLTPQASPRKHRPDNRPPVARSPLNRHATAITATAGNPSALPTLSAQMNAIARTGQALQKEYSTSSRMRGRRSRSHSHTSTASNDSFSDERIMIEAAEQHERETYQREREQHNNSKPTVHDGASLSHSPSPNSPQPDLNDSAASGLTPKPVIPSSHNSPKHSAASRLEQSSSYSQIHDELDDRNDSPPPPQYILHVQPPETTSVAPSRRRNSVGAEEARVPPLKLGVEPPENVRKELDSRENRSHTRHRSQQDQNSASNQTDAISNDNHSTSHRTAPSQSSGVSIAASSATLAVAMKSDSVTSSPARKLDEKPLPSSSEYHPTNDWIDDDSLNMTLGALQHAPEDEDQHSHSIPSQVRQPHELQQLANAKQAPQSQLMSPGQPLDHTYVNELDYSSYVIAGSPLASPPPSKFMLPPNHQQMHQHARRLDYAEESSGVVQLSPSHSQPISANGKQQAWMNDRFATAPAAFQQQQRAVAVSHHPASRHFSSMQPNDMEQYEQFLLQQKQQDAHQHQVSPPGGRHSYDEMRGNYPPVLHSVLQPLPPSPPFAEGLSPEEIRLQEEERRFVHYQLQRQLLRQAITPPSQMKAALRGAPFPDQSAALAATYYPPGAQPPALPHHRREAPPPSVAPPQLPANGYAQSIHSNYPSLRQPLSHHQQRMREQRHPSADSNAHEHFYDDDDQYDDRDREREREYHQSHQPHPSLPSREIHSRRRPASDEIDGSHVDREDRDDRRRSPPPPPPATTAASTIRPPASPPLPTIARAMAANPPGPAMSLPPSAAAARPNPPASPPLPAQRHTMRERDEPPTQRERTHVPNRNLSPARASVPGADSNNGRASSPLPSDVASLRQQIDRLTADAARQTARESNLMKECKDKDRLIEVEREKVSALQAELVLAQDRLHELNSEISGLRTNLAATDERASSSHETLVKQKRMLSEASTEITVFKEKQIRASRIIQQLSKRLATFTNSTPEQILDSIDENTLGSTIAAAIPPPPPQLSLNNAAPQRQQGANNGPADYTKRGSHNESQLHFQDPIEPASTRNARPPTANIDPSLRPPAGLSQVQPPVSPHRRPHENMSSFDMKDASHLNNNRQQAGPQLFHPRHERERSFQNEMPPAGVAPHPRAHRADPRGAPMGREREAHQVFPHHPHERLDHPFQEQNRERGRDRSAPPADFDRRPMAQHEPMHLHRPEQHRRAMSPPDDFELRQSVHQQRSEHEFRDRIPPPNFSDEEDLDMLIERELQFKRRLESDMHSQQQQQQPFRHPGPLSHDHRDERRFVDDSMQARRRPAQFDEPPPHPSQQRQPGREHRFDNHPDDSFDASASFNSTAAAPRSRAARAKSPPEARFSSYLASVSPTREKEKEASERERNLSPQRAKSPPRGGGAAGSAAANRARSPNAGRPNNARSPTRAKSPPNRGAARRATSPSASISPPRVRGALSPSRNSQARAKSPPVHAPSTGSSEFSNGVRTSVQITQPSRPASAASAPFATSVRSAPDASSAFHLDQLERDLSEMLRQKEALETAIARASRPGASFDATVLPSAQAAAQSGGSSINGARSRHAMMKEGEVALQQLEKTIHAQKANIRKMQTLMGIR